MTATGMTFTCQELVELVTAYLEDGLPPEDRARFDAHIEVCPGCRAYLAQIERTIGLSGALTPAQLDPEAEAALLEAFRDWHEAGRRS